VAHVVDIRGTHSTFLSSTASTGLPIAPDASERIFFSITIHNAEPVVIALMRNEPLRIGLQELTREGDAGEALGEPSRDPRAATLLLISSGLAGLSATTRRRRGLPARREARALWFLPKEVSSSVTSFSRLSRSAQGSHSPPLRI
jgi:hypothetical protein